MACLSEMRSWTRLAPEESCLGRRPDNGGERAWGREAAVWRAPDFSSRATRDERIPNNSCFCKTIRGLHKHKNSISCHLSRLNGGRGDGPEPIVDDRQGRRIRGLGFRSSPRCRRGGRHDDGHARGRNPSPICPPLVCEDRPGRRLQSRVRQSSTCRRLLAASASVLNCWFRLAAKAFRTCSPWSFRRAISSPRTGHSRWRALPVWQTTRITGFSAAAPYAGTVLTEALPASVPITAVYHVSPAWAVSAVCRRRDRARVRFRGPRRFRYRQYNRAFACARRAGWVHYMLNQSWGVFFDAKKFFDRSVGKATGLNFGPPVGVINVTAASVTHSQPWVLSTGLTYRF